MIIRTIAAVSLITGGAHAQDSGVLIDVEAELNAKLSQTPYVLKERFIEVDETHCVRERRGDTGLCSYGEILSLTPNTEYLPACAGNESCLTVKVRKADRYKIAPTVESIEFLSVSGLTLDEANATSLPEITYYASVKAVNCANKLDNGNENLYRVGKTISIKVSERVSHSVTHGIKTGVSVGANLSYKSQEGFSGGTNITVTKDITFTTNDTVAESWDRTETFVANLTVPNRRTQVHSATILERTLLIPFSATVLVDGKIAENLDGITKVSQRLSEEQRTIGVSGYLEVTGASEMETKLQEHPVTEHECPEPTDAKQYSVVSPFVALEGAESIFSGRLLIAPQSVNAERRAVTIKGLSYLFGNPASWCYVGGCNIPPDGYREVCYFDDEGFCNDCGEEPDAVCDPLDIPEE